MLRARVAVGVGLLFFAGVLTAQQQDQKKAAKELPPEEIIKAFTAKETQFREAWNQYYYRQVASVKVLTVDGAPSNEAMTLIFEVVFKDDGSRDVRLIERTGRLRSVMWTPDDQDVITNYQPFTLTTKDLPLYELNYEGKERVDELDTYVFSVKPRTIEDDSFFFQGRIWVDDLDLQIVRTVGKVVSRKQEDPYVQFPEFETIRQLVDGKYWFPVWSHADTRLDFPDRRVRVEETITYEGFRQFKSSVDVKPIKK